MPFCCVPMCSERSGRTKKDYHKPKITFHTLPKEPEVLEQFAQRIRREIGPKFKVNMHTRICSKHYKMDDFYCYHVPLGRRQLKPGVLPSLFDFSPKPKEKNTVKPVSRACARKVLAENGRKYQESSSPSCDSCYEPNSADPLLFYEPSRSPVDVKPKRETLWSETKETSRESHHARSDDCVEELGERLEKQKREIFSLTQELTLERQARRLLEMEISELKTSVREMQDQLVSAQTELHELQQRGMRQVTSCLRNKVDDLRRGVYASDKTGCHELVNSDRRSPEIRIKTEIL